MYASGSFTKSRKHSSTTRKTECSLHVFKISIRKSRSVRIPVGLLGLHKNIISNPFLISSRKEASIEKFVSSFRKKWLQTQSTLVRACSYSAKVGAGRSAFFGFKARHKEKISSAAPFPQITWEGFTPSYCAMASFKGAQPTCG